MRVVRAACLLTAGSLVVAAGGALAANAKAAIYWADVDSNAIAAADSGGTHINRSFITGANAPSDVLVHGDWIYWGNATSGCTESGSCAGTIGRARLNGTDVRQDFIHTDTPYGLAIYGGHIYWTNFGTNTIGRANLDGSGADQRFITGASAPDGVVVNAQHIYWSNSGANTIGEANLGGGHVNQSFITGAEGPQGMAINGSHLYWANHNNGTIGRASLSGSGADQHFISDPGSYPTRVTVTRSAIYWTSLASDQIPSPGSIGKAALNGTHVKPNFIRDGSTPVGVAVTGGPLVDAVRCHVPAIVHRFATTAELAVGAANCRIGNVTYAYSPTVPRNDIISQSPAPGTILPKGAKVRFVISYGRG